MAWFVGLVLMAAPVTFASAESTPHAPASPLDVPTPPVTPEQAPWTRARLLARLSLPIDVEFNEHPLHDVVRYLELVTGAQIHPLWSDQDHEVGLDPMAPTTLDARGLSALQALEAALDQAAAHQHMDMGATWQFAPDGQFECGPRERLNRSSALRVEVYDVTDLLASTPTATVAPRLNVSHAARPGPRSNVIGASWDFSDDTPRPAESDTPPADDPGSRLIQTITALVEPEQWIRNGGEAAAISLHQGALIVLAPDYIHRGLAGPLSASGLEELRTKSE